MTPDERAEQEDEEVAYQDYQDMIEEEEQMQEANEEEDTIGAMPKLMEPIEAETTVNASRDPQPFSA